jgi:hypothetical protein
MLWGDAEARTQVLLDLLAAWDRDDSAALGRALLRLDSAVTAGLAALGLGRDPGAAVRLDRYARGWIGRVAIDGTIHLDVDQVRHYVVEERQPDRVVHTLVHESLHARAPATPARGAEAAQWKGYQEGMVEGLTRIVTGDRAGMRVLDPAYDFYVAAYRALAVVARLDLEELWRALWRARPGQVRERFAETVDAVGRRRGAPALDAGQLRRLGRMGDRVFAGDRFRDPPDERGLIQRWEAALR